MAVPTCLTCAYKNISGLKVELDLYLPSLKEGSDILRPTFVYFHGGGLTVGEKTSWFPFWLHGRAMANGFAFISPDYQLLPPATGHEILTDIKDLFTFLEHGVNDFLKAQGRDDQIDIQRIAVGGTSGGSLCAYLAGIHARPKPRVVLSMYGMGGDFFTPRYLMPKTTPFFRGRELLDPETFSEFMFPNLARLTPTSSSQLSYHGPDYSIPGYPSNPRMLLARLYMQLGNFIDYYTGQHQPSLSQKLKTHLNSNDNINLTAWKTLLPTTHHPIFPQLNISAFPPTFLIHGSKDTAVSIKESFHLHTQLQSSGVASVLRVCEGMEHSFDYQLDAEHQWGVVFDEALRFVKDQFILSGGVSLLVNQT